MLGKEARKRSDRSKVIFPLVSRASSFSELSQSQFAELEAAGQISLPPATRRDLNSIADSWISHDIASRSPRPAEFRARLRLIIDTLQAAHTAAELNGDNASIFESHMFHWLFLGDIPGAGDALTQLGCLPNLINFFKKAKEALPTDRGSTRPLDDHRFIQLLADQFEACGGKARIYFSDKEGHYVGTPFHKFVRKFLSCLKLQSGRTALGLGEAIRLALRQRRRCTTGKTR